MKNIKKRIIRSLTRRILSSLDLDPSQSTNGSILHNLKELNSVKYSIKQEGYNLSKMLYNRLKLFPIPTNPNDFFSLNSMACKQADLETKWFRYWCNELKLAPLPHRKLWEFAYILNNLHTLGYLKKDLSAIGFGCGQEPLPSYFTSIGIETTITDLAPEKVKNMGWAETNQHTNNLESVFIKQIVTKSEFMNLAKLRYIDMNKIPKDLDNSYDICWSVCALEHLGSIQKGLDFIKNSLRVLKPGGIAIHTTEYNYTEKDKTIDNYSTVLFLRKHFEKIYNELVQEKYIVEPLCFDIGDRELDSFVDLPPYGADNHYFHLTKKSDPNENDYEPGHLKLSVDGFPSTCFALTIRKPK